MKVEKAHKILQKALSDLNKEFKEILMTLDYKLMFFCACVENTITECIMSAEIVASDDLLVTLHNNISFSEAARTIMKVALQRKEEARKRKKQNTSAARNFTPRTFDDLM